MRPDMVLSRTPRGAEVLLNRGTEISTNQRRALLVVDGKTTVANLEKNVFWVTDVISALEELHAMGLIHDGASTINAEAGMDGGAGRQLKVQLAAIARELLGSNAERIIKKMDEADGTPDALEQALLGCKKLIKLTINEELADTFLQHGRKVIGK